MKPVVTTIDGSGKSAVRALRSRGVDLEPWCDFNLLRLSGWHSPVRQKIYPAMLSLTSYRAKLSTAFGLILIGGPHTTSRRVNSPPFLLNVWCCWEFRFPGRD